MPHRFPVMQKLKLNPPRSKSHSEIIINAEKVAAGTGILCDHVDGKFTEVDGEGTVRGHYERVLAKTNKCRWGGEGKDGSQWRERKGPEG